MAKTWFQRSASEVETELTVQQSKGLSASEVTARLRKYGRNELQASKPINPLKLFFGQFKDALIIILLVAAVVSWGLGLIGTEEKQKPAAVPTQCATLNLTAEAAEELGCNVEASEESEGAQEALLIFAIVIAIALIGFFNEYKAEKTVEALKKLVGQKAKVRRGVR